VRDRGLLCGTEGQKSSYFTGSDGPTASHAVDDEGEVAILGGLANARLRGGR